MTYSSSPAALAALASNDVTDTDAWEHYQLDLQLLEALAKQKQEKHAEVITEADALVDLFDQMLQEVTK